MEIKVLIVFLLNIILFTKAINNPSNAIDLIIENDYPYEKHAPVTEDGYVLSLIRIPHGKKNVTKKNVPVLLHHGLIGCAAQFLTNPNRSLVYILADIGYDVWLLNSRGVVKDTQKNVYIIDEETNKKAFYNYSFHEIGIYDNPAAIDYILNHTNKKQLHYIGHSQGCTTFFVMTSERPEYNDKVLLASMLSPSANLVTASPLFRFVIVPFLDIITFAAKLLHIYDIPYITIREVLTSVCSHSVFYFVCGIVFNSAYGYSDNSEIDSESYKKIFRSTPADISVKQFFHYMQLIRSGGRFQQYDYGHNGNLKQYNSSVPPAYDVSKITTPLAIYVGRNDLWVSVKNAETLEKNLKQDPYFYIVPHKGWNHGDFLWANDVVKLLYDEVLTVMIRHEN